MRQIVLITALTLVPTYLYAAEDPSSEDQTTTLIIRVHNGTTGGRPVLDDEVTVSVYHHGELLTVLEGKVGPNGAAVFEDVPAEEHIRAVAQVMHDDMKFGGHSVALPANRLQTTDSVHVYDVSHDANNLSVKVHHLTIRRRGGYLELSEFMQVSNSSDRAVSSQHRDSDGRAIVLVMPVPRGYEDLKTTSYLVPSALGFAEDNFYDTMAMPPGEHNIKFSYSLDIKSDKMDIAKRISLPTASFVLFSQVGREALQGLSEPADQIVLSDGAAADFYSLSSLTAGAEVAFTISGLSDTPAGRSTWIILAGTFTALVVLALSRLRPTMSQAENAAVIS